MLLPATANDEAPGWRPRDHFEFSFLYAHRRSPPASSVGKGSALEAARGDSASVHTQARGVPGSPVATQVQVKRPIFEVVKRLFFMVPPFAVRAAATASGARGAERQHESSVRGVSLGSGDRRAHALKSQVVCCDER
jgi:hypothetical protein